MANVLTGLTPMTMLSDAVIGLITTSKGDEEAASLAYVDTPPVHTVVRGWTGPGSVSWEADDDIR